MDELIKILRSVNDDIDYENEKHLVTSGIIDSIDLTSMIVEIEDHYNIEIDLQYMVNERFDSVESILELIKELL